LACILHPYAKRLLESELGSKSQLTISKMRDLEHCGLSPISDRPAVSAIEDRTIPGPSADLPIRIYTPEGQGPFPMLVFFHGGGFVRGSIETHDVSCRHIVRTSGWKVISVAYRLAPEHPFPVALEDCYAAIQWVAAHAKDLQGDPVQLAVGGESAGGNLAAAVSLMARDKGEPFLSKQVLIYPVIDYHRHGQRSSYPSYEDKGRGFGLTCEGMGLYWQYYLKKESDGTRPYASPIRSADLSKLPMALIITAEFDPLCDEGERYACMLGQAGVLVVSKRFDGMIHGFLNWQEDIDEKANAYNLIAAFLHI
jgi:acetyl esterase